MDLELVKTFVAVLREGSVGRAAETLHVSQPAVSTRIRELERQLEVRLFDRVGRKLRVTAAGQLLATESAKLLAAAKAVREKLDALRQLRSGTVQLATLDAGSIYLLPEVYRAFLDAHPDVELRVRVVDSHRVLRAVRDLEADIGVVALPEKTDIRGASAELVLTPIYEDRLVCVAAPTHPLAGKSRLDLARVAAHPLVLYDRGSITRGTIDTVFAGLGLRPNVVMETASPEAMKRLAEVGVGVAILPQALIESDVKTGRLALLETRDAHFVRILATAIHGGRSLSGAAARFLELVYARWRPLAPHRQGPAASKRRQRRYG